jgi:ribonuclease R
MSRPSHRTGPSRRTRKDPYAAREAERYARPVPSREFILEYLWGCDGPRTVEEIARALGVRGDDQLTALGRRLNAMERDAQLIRNRRDAYGAPAKMDLLTGRVIGHRDGFGFLVRDEGGDDVFLSARQMKSLLHGDRAVVRVTGLDRRGRTEGALVEVVERANQEVVGRFFEEAGIGRVVPDNKRLHQDVLIPSADSGGAGDGQIVVAKIVQQPDWRRPPLGRVVEILGDHMAPGMEIDVAIRAYGLPSAWPEEIQHEVEALPTSVSRRDLVGRLDLRGLPLVTIDGEDAQDFDDAVYCERNGSGWRLYVAIADVGHYVKPGTALDCEARNRGNSVYFPDRVIPMLPEALSNGLCSLNPEVDRLCLCCILDIGPRGRIGSHRFHEAVMRSAARLTYSEVHGIVTLRDAALRERFRDLAPHLDALHILYRHLKKRREARGAIDFDTHETRIVFGADRKVDRIVPLHRNEAHRLIEECMIAANVAAAELLTAHEVPSLYRVHDRPDREKLADVRTFLGELGLTLGGGEEPHPRDYAVLLAAVQDRPDAGLIETVLLRSLRLAGYSPENIGHFGLAHPAYTHFTSPIRRYPDLLVHRALRHLLSKRRRPFIYPREEMPVLADHCSSTERRADEATRDAITWLKCEYMLDKVGEVFDGVITSVTSFGLFVEIKDIHIEGLTHVTSLKNDYYHHDPVRHRLRGERSGRVYRLAGPVRVRVVRVDLDRRRIDFDVVEESSKKGPRA